MHNSKRIEWFVLAIVITFSSHALPRWVAGAAWTYWRVQLSDLGWTNFFYLCTLLFGVLLVAPSPRRYGICVGQISRYPWRTLIVCAIPVVLTAIVYPQLAVRPFAGGPIGAWLISPAAQNLVFSDTFTRTPRMSARITSIHVCRFAGRW